MKKLFYLLLILLFPSIIYLVFSTGEHHVERLGFYGPSLINSEGDTVYKPVMLPLSLDEQGKPMNPAELLGQVTLVHLFEYPCDDTCKTEITTLTNYLDRLEVKDKWTLVSICTTVGVIPPHLAELKSKIVFGDIPWKFVFPPSEGDMQRYIKGACIGMETEERPKLILMDQEARVRAYFDTRTYQDSKKLEDAIKMLIQEPHLHWKDEKK